MTGRLILASTSASRRKLLSASGVPVTVVAPNVDEEALKRTLRRSAGPSPAGMAMRLAGAKAVSVSERYLGDLVLGGDQVLDLDGQVMDKPGSMAAARRQLLQLAGRTHRLITAAAVARKGRVVWRSRLTARLTMRNVSEAFLRRYLDAERDHVTRTAGAYRLEALGAQLFTEVRGDYFGILGLPLVPLLAFLRREGVIGS